MRIVTCDHCNAKEEEGIRFVGIYHLCGLWFDLCSDCLQLHQIWNQERREFYDRKLDEESIRWIKGEAI